MAANLILTLILLLQIQFETLNAQCVSALGLTAHLDYSGQIKSPNYPNNYDDRTNCQWLITATTGVVVLSIQDMHLESGYDFVYFYEVHDWPTSTCASTINISTNDIQQLKLPNAPASTNPMITNCDVTFSVSSSNLNVTLIWSDLTFTSNNLNVTSTQHCYNQYGLSVWDGTGSTLLYWLCNANQSPDDTIVIYPTQTSVTFRYNSPSDTRGPVISIQAYAGTAATETVPVLTTQSIVSSCGSSSLVAESHQKFLTSPNYPSYYSNDLACTWMIASVDTSKVITLTIISLYTEAVYDYLYVYDGPSTGYPVIGSRYSGSYLNTVLLVLSLITYFSGYSKYWLITKPEVSDTLTFYFAAFRLESCSYDTLKVYKGACDYDTHLHTFCGEIDLSESYSVSLSRYVLFYMNTDSSVRYTGFDLRYRIGDTTEHEYEDENNIPIVTIVVPVVVVSAIIIAVICKVVSLRAKTTKSTAKVSPPSITNYKLTATTKVKIPKQKPIRKKATVKTPAADPSPPVPPQPTTIQQPVAPSAPHIFQDPAYPPLPQNFGGSVPPIQQTYYNTNPNSNPTPLNNNVPDPFVYTPPY
ncbi:deleted in malignant brain tumors 1 protein-like [Ylistrum balloti]|uniref:deleted in malignant brain tumors 1 protein-like n=1 Tax=Ylistrum balloti TaxID=509963 RepID=UPI002905BA0D|nr:deleted in malignant brain tumors 1 protein-like [Ylistrum balloti]